MATHLENGLQRFERVERDDDPSRCLATHKDYQCPYKQVPGSKYCPRHGGNKALQAAAIAERRIYLVSQWQDQIRQQADHPNLKTNREEIGVLRMILQRELARCEDDTELLLHSTRIMELVREINKAVQACQKLEEQLGKVLDHSQAVSFVQDILTIITTHVVDPNTLSIIGSELEFTMNQYFDMTQNNNTIHAPNAA